MPQDELEQPVKPGAHHSCAEAWTSGAVSGCLAGLVSGMIWGIIQEKKFIFRNMGKELHLREHPIQLFSVMMRGTKTMAILGTFFGVLRGLRCNLCNDVLDRDSPFLPAAAGAAAGLTQTLISEVPASPATHGWRATKAGLVAAGVFTAAEWTNPKHTEDVLDTAAPD
ncbi:hypothetical protein ABBQ32_001936 [Trebouxia sp. C0010 RCD-2024]